MPRPPLPPLHERRDVDLLCHALRSYHELVDESLFAGELVKARAQLLVLRSAALELGQVVAEELASLSD